MAIEIEVFADIWCPFAHVGLRCARDQRDATGRVDVVIRVRPWPLELVNSAPMDPAKTASHIEHLRHQINDNQFVGFDATNFPSSTLEALALIEHAYATDARTGEAATFVVRDALFEKGLDISDPAVLESIAADLLSLIPGTPAKPGGSRVRPISSPVTPKCSAHRSTSPAAMPATCPSPSISNGSTPSLPSVWAEGSPSPDPERSAGLHRPVRWFLTVRHVSMAKPLILP